MRTRVRFVPIAVAAALVTVSTGELHAACNLIPGATRTFAGDTGTLNRPYAAPGEPLELAVRTCDAASPGLAASGPEHVVSVVIRPASGGTGKLIAVATDCNAVNTGACPGSVCKQVTPAELAVVLRNGRPQLRFPFPNTDAELPPNGDGLTLAGPTAIAVTRVGESLPCGLTGGSCGAQSGLTACVDTLFFDDGGCGQAFAHPTFPSFTALPVPNDYRADCFTTSPPCTAAASQLRLAVDAAGNVLAPFDWSGVLAATSAPVPRELTIHVQPPAPVADIPSQAFLASYTPEGALLPPIFEPQGAAGAAPNTLKMFGSADAPYTILRIARRRGTCASGPNVGAACTGPQDCTGAPCPTACVGGGNDGAVCTTGSQCPAGTCGTLFDFAPLAGSGSLVIPRLGPGICQLAPHADCMVDGDCPGGPGDPCVHYAFEAGVAHDLNGVVATDESFAFVVSERVHGSLLNGGVEDPMTANDDVLILRDRVTGDVQPIGNEAVCGINQNPEPPGRAVVSLADPPFQFHAVAGEGDVVAFLESEIDQDQCDANGDGDDLDAILRVYRLGPTEITAGMNLTADAGLLVNRRSLAISNGRVFFRRPEQGSGVASRVWASVDPSGAGGNDNSGIGLGTGKRLSHDGRMVVFSTFATNLAPNLVTRHVIARDLVAGTTETVDIGFGGLPVGGGYEAISGDGNFVVFLSTSPVLPESNGTSQAYVRDLVNDTTEMVSVSSSEVMGNGSAENVNASYDGRFVVFAATGTNLAAPCTNGERHVFVRDRQSGTTECVSRTTGGVAGDGWSDYPQISDDGRFVAFQSAANNLVPDDANQTANGDIFLHDRATGETTLVSRDGAGTQINSLMFFPRLSGDGHHLAYELHHPTHCPLGSCVVVKDLVTGAFDSPTRSETGLALPLGYSGIGSISYDGRYLAFYSNADDIVPGASDNVDDVFIIDRLTGATTWASPTDAGGNSAKRNFLPYISGDGRSVAFWAYEALDPDDTVSTCNPEANTECIGGGNDGAACTVASECPGGTCDQTFIENCTDVYVHRLGPDNDCGDSVLDPGEDCDPPGAPAGACGGENCSFTCHCGDNDADLTGDGTLDQTVLQMVDARPGMTEGDLTSFCPADQVVVGGGTAVFLRPEAAGDVLPANCPNVGASLNPPDGDALDTVVHLTVLGATPAQNLGRAATALALGATCSGSGAACSQDTDCAMAETCRPPYVAALVSEPQENGAFLNGDGDGVDTVLNVYKLTAPLGWQAIADVQAADAVDMKGILAVFTTPEAAQGDGPLNGDGDDDDRVLRLWDAATATLTDLQITAEDFVVGDPALIDCGAGPELHQVVAFRTSEAAEGTGPLNDDGDTLDSTLYIVDYDLTNHVGTLIDKQVSVVTCPLEACDPRFPYRVIGKRVRFLTREPQQGNRDLNGDGDATDLILQTIDVCTGALTPIAAVDEGADDDWDENGNDPTEDPTGDDSNVVVSDGGRCVQGMTMLLVPATCTVDADCPAGAVCIADYVVVATPLEDLDFDGVPDGVDNCPTVFNDTQLDVDADGLGNACDLDLACASAPRAGCRAPILGGKSMLQIKHPLDPTKDAIQWTWRKGAATDVGDLGDPTSGDDYAWCLYDESGVAPELVLEATAPASGTCANGKLCWKPSGTSGFQYADKDATPLGLTQIKIKAGADGKAQATVKGKGTRLVMPAFPLGLPLRAQLVAGNGECWEALHEVVVKSDGTQLKVKDAP